MTPPPDFLLNDLAPLAHQRLGDAAWAYLAGGAADELTLGENTCAWRRLKLSPRVLRRTEATISKRKTTRQAT